MRNLLTHRLEIGFMLVVPLDLLLQLFDRIHSPQQIVGHAL